MINITKSRMNQFGYAQWASYFAENDLHRLDIDFSQERELTEAEKALVFPSIRAFQKGEGSDGAYLMKAVEAFVDKGGEAAYRDAMLWFVKEENWHSAYLRKYMDFYQVKTVKNSFLDQMFRRLRKLGGLKCEVTILVTAEMIALTYYDALSKCTESPVLQSICGQMLHDELPHIMFQSHTLGRLGRKKYDNIVRILFMEGTLLPVWCLCHRVYRAGGYSFAYFIKENLGYLRQSILLAAIGS